jgi:hypothetical protein
MRQCLNQLRRRGVCERRRGIEFCCLVHDAIDSTESGWLIEFSRDDVIAKVDGRRRAILNDSSIHVDNVERAVGSVRDVNGTKALISRREKLGVVVRFSRSQRRPIVAEDNAADEVCSRVGDERITV